MTPLAVEDTPLDFGAVGNDTAPDRPFLRYRWDFGDGTGPPPALVSPKCKHTYTQAGDFLATVTVADDDGAKSNASLEITVANVPPAGAVELADVTVDEDGTLTLKGSGTDTPSDLPSLAYRWDLGDGNLTDWGPDASATHKYTMSGSYTAVFFVRDRYNATADATVNVMARNLPPKCSISTQDQETTEDSVVPFDGTGRDTPTDMLSLVYRWDFGDGNLTDWAVDPSAEHAYAQNGVYDATFTVRDNDGAAASAAVVVTVDNVAPVANARAQRTSVDEDTAVLFNATGSTDTPSDLPLLAYSWDFGDGRGAEGAVASHGYSKQKTYTVVLTVKDDDGATSTAELKVRVSDVPPSLEVSANRLRAPAGVAFSLGAAANDTPSDLPVLKYEWNFGDLSTAQGRNVTHAYTSPGRYTVTARVSDDEDGVAEQKLVLEVYEAERPPAPASGAPSAAIIGGAAGAVAAVAVAAGIIFMIRRKKPPAKEVGPEKPPGAADKSAAGK
jgi:PKD repeat protein